MVAAATTGEDATVAAAPADADTHLKTNTMKKSKKKKKDADVRNIHIVLSVMFLIAMLFLTQGEGKKEPMIAKVVAPYEATSKEQLTLAQGQLILVRKKTETGWWQGEIQGGKGAKKRNVGWFPASFVQLMEGPGGGGGGGAAAAAEAKPDKGEPLLKALYTYAAQQEDELSFEVD